jgi:hypothetical protein
MEPYNELHCKKEMKIIPGATHLFEEPGTLEEVARLASDWFSKHFKKSDRFLKRIGFTFSSTILT